MRRKRIWIAAATAVALVSGLAAPSAWAIKLDEKAIYIEINDTDGDAGVHIFLDAEGWEMMTIRDPNGEAVLFVVADGSVAFQGITELFLESAEPSFDEQPLEELLALFPEGRYKFRGVTTEGRKLRGSALLTHNLPDAPEQIFPNEDEVDPANAIFEWALVDDPPGSEIVGYHVVVECEEPGLREFTADVGPETTRVTVPPEFLEGGDECKWEVLAIETSGNQTISEAEFEIQ